MAFSTAWRWMRVRRTVLYKHAQVGVPLLLLGCSVWAWLSAGGVDEVIRMQVFDTYERLRPRAYEDAGVRVVDIDDESLKRIGQWPWPRTTLAKLVDRLGKGGASAVAFDALFAEADRSSPRLVAENVADAALKERLRALPDHDEAFARAFSRARVVLAFAIVDDDNRVVPPLKTAFGTTGESPLVYLHNYSGAIRSLPVLEKAASGSAAISVVPDRDGLIRRAPLLFKRDRELLPSLALETLRVAQGASVIQVKTSGGSNERNFGQRTGIVKIKVGRLAIPTDSEGRIWIYFTKDDSSRTVPAWKVLENKLAPGALEGVLAFVGTSAVGLKDMRATPLESTTPGVMIHANVAEQAILGKFLRRPDWADGVELLWMVALGLGLLALLPLVGAGWCGLAAVAAIAWAFWASWHLFTRRGLLIDPLYPSLTVFLMYFSSAVISYLKSESERRQVKGAFSRYMSPALVEQLAKNPEKLRLGGETREMTFHFCDIRGFTTISEQFDPHGLTQFINSFLTPMTDIILRHQGVIDKYMGDCIMAFWNAPLDDAQHARHACQAALAMHVRLRELNEAWKDEAAADGRKYIPIHIGTGLNTGKCIVGNMGSDQRFDYSVLGDDVNLASRLEGQSKTYGVDVVVGARTRELAPEFAFVELDLIRVKGKTRPVHIFALAGPPDLARREDFQRFLLSHDGMLQAYRARKWDEAARLLDECRGGPVDLHKLYALYEERIESHRCAAPAADWDGSHTASSK